MKKFSVIVFVFVLLASCDKFRGDDGRDGNSCSVVSESDTTVITCTDGSTTTIMNGKDGLSGSDGENSDPCTVQRVGNATVVSCPDGTNSTVYDGVNGQDGADGTDGTDGATGPQGVPGPSYSPDVTIIEFPTQNTCKEVYGYYVKRISGNRLEFWTNPGCTGTSLFNTSTMVELCGDPLTLMYVAIKVGSPSVLTATIVEF